MGIGVQSSVYTDAYSYASQPDSNAETVAPAVGADGDGGAEGDVSGASFFAEDAQGPDPFSGEGGQSADEARSRLDELTQFLSQKQFSEDDQKRLAQEILDLQNRIPAQGILPEALNGDLAALEAEILGTSVDAANAGEGSDPAPLAQIKNLKDEIEKADFPSGQKQEWLTQLDRLNSNLELQPEGNDSILQQLQDIQDAVEKFKANPAAANQLAAALHKDVSEISELAKESGVDLENLPNPPDQKVMDFLNELGIPKSTSIDQYQALSDQRKANIKALKGVLAAEDQAWKIDEKMKPNVADFKASLTYWDFKDSEYQQMDSLASRMRDEVSQALQSLGYTAQAGKKSDQILVGGKTVEILNKNTNSLTLSTALTKPSRNPNDFYPAPVLKKDSFPGGETGGKIVGGVIGGVVGAVVSGGLFAPVTVPIGVGVGMAIGGDLAKKQDADLTFVHLAKKHDGYPSSE